MHKNCGGREREEGRKENTQKRKYSRRLKQMNNEKVSLVRIKIQKRQEGQ